MQAEAYRGQAAVLQTQISQLQQEEQELGQRASARELELQRTKAQHRHAIQALQQVLDAEAQQQRLVGLQAGIAAAEAETAILRAEAADLDSKAQKLGVQLSSSSHMGSAENVASLMTVLAKMQQRSARQHGVVQERERDLEARRADSREAEGQVAVALLTAKHLMSQADAQHMVGRPSTRAPWLGTGEGGPALVRTCMCIIRHSSTYSNAMCVACIRLHATFVRACGCPGCRCSRRLRCWPT